jgi:hypothetical protein
VTAICIAEDRASCEPALRLLIGSLNRCCGKRFEIHVFHPGSNDTFSSWASKYPQVKLHRNCLPKDHGWNVKPLAMLYLLDRGYDDVTWIDSDIIVTRDIANVVRGLDANTMVVAEEALWGNRDDTGALRTRLWGFRVGRTLPFTLNSGVIRITTAHYSLLKRWRELLESETYCQMQSMHGNERPVHMFSDQDVLTALLASVEYADVPLKVLKRGDIIQFFGPTGYTVAERVTHLLGFMPTFIHAQGPKPWMPSSNDIGERGRSQRMKKYWQAVYFDLSPYTVAARRFEAELQGTTGWMRSRFVLSAMLRSAGFWYPPLVGLPIAAAVDVARSIGLVQLGNLTGNPDARFGWRRRRTAPAKKQGAEFTRP